MVKRKRLISKDTVQTIVFILLGLLTVAGIEYSRFYLTYIKDNTTLAQGSEHSLYIHSNDSFDDIIQIIARDSVIKDFETFMQVVNHAEYDKNYKPGHFIIKSGMGNKEIVNTLMKGLQTPVNVTFIYSRYIEKIIESIGRQIEADSASLLEKYNNEEFLKSLGLTKDNKYLMVIPNTYEFYWNTNAEGFWKRMKIESDRFWNGERAQKAEAMNFTLEEVVTLASIVEMETNKNDEKPCIAGVYINRLKKGILLQADPTLAYLIGWGNRRILNKHKKLDSPYNTYKYKGLPPGPICFPSIETIDAVLNYEQHDYLFFCASPDFSGYHNFASTYSQHRKNAGEYQRALNNRKIW